MKELLQALLLGIVQGLTEFLPVSSSGHIELFKYYFGSEAMAEAGLTFTVTLHAATALSTMYVYRRDISRIFRNVLKRPFNESHRYVLFLALSMIPAVIVGLYLESLIESMFSGNILLVAGMLCITGILLLLADLPRDLKQPLNSRRSILIGIAQAIAIVPGISRSGSTISTSVLLGLKRKEAARFSFLMVLPLILGKMAKDLLNYEEAFQNVALGGLLIGFLGAFITGVLACRWMIALVERSRLSWFAVYCFIVAAIVFIHQILV